MDPEYRAKLISLLAKMNQLTARADELMAGPTIDPEDDRRAAAVVTILKRMRDRVEAKLGALG